MPARPKKKGGGKKAHHDEEDQHHGMDPPAEHPVSSSLRGSETLKMMTTDEEKKENTAGGGVAAFAYAEATTSSSDKIDSSQDDDKETDNPTEENAKYQLASISEVFSYGSSRTKFFCLSFGFMCAAVSGAVPVGIIFYFSTAFEDLVADPSSADFMGPIREVAYAFLILGVVAFCSLCGYATLLETSAGFMTQDFKQQWFKALLRQDMAYFDIQDVSGVASLISANASKYKRGIGIKLGMLVNFTVTFLGGLGYAFYSSWQTTLVVLCTVPFMVVSGWFLVKMTTTTTQRANQAYSTAGSIVYTTASSIRTILSLNAVAEMVDKFTAATQKAFDVSSSQAVWLGVANGCMMASFLVSSIVVPLYGGYLLWSQITENGCDPSASFSNTCDPTGVDIFGAMFGVFTAASVLPQIGTITEAFTQARAAVYLAHQVMDRKLPDDTIHGSTAKQQQQQLIKETDGVADMTVRRGQGKLPEYRIDSSSHVGLKPERIDGFIDFENVTFSYPTRLESKVFDNFNLTVKAGQSVAIVGPSGSGKSTLVQLLERNYDVSGGSIKLDGNDLRDINVKHLRQHLGYISQEPKLFACTIRENIAYGNPSATFEDIVEAAKAANAHLFIEGFPDGYETQVGDLGGKLSGGQKQRIAIARVLVRKPSVLLLDEATSALDTESERQVQDSLDKLMQERKRTTIIIAHRLTTVRNADVIAVVEDGKVVESGTHEDLIANQGEYFRLVEAQTNPSDRAANDEDGKNMLSEESVSRHSSFAETDTDQLPILRFRNVKFHYPTRQDKTIFRKLNLSVRRGETLALVGPSGHGKSSIIQLIERFYDPTGGSIELNGINLKDLNVSWLHDQVGLVSQEPTLFDASVAENVRFGCLNATQEEIEDVCRKANIHDTIMAFPDGYDTQVASGSQVSGGQKQRICIARALLRKPKILLLDEATSALDSTSEKIVQQAIDDITTSSTDLTTIMIAHRLSSIQKADRIAVIYDGRVKEIGTHDELIAKPKGIYRRLQAFRDADQGATVVADASKKKKSKKSKDELPSEDILSAKDIEKKKEQDNAKRARLLAQDDWSYFLVGGIGATLAGAIFPAWGFIFAYTIELLYTPVFPCDTSDPTNTCQAEWDAAAEHMQDLAANIAYGSLGTLMASLIGNTLLYWGFGVAVERMNRRVRNEMYRSLIRQEVGYFDAHPVGSLTAQLQDDAALVHSFSGEPIRSLIVSLSSVVVGLVVGFVFMWPFALLFLGILPFMGFGAEMEMKMYVAPPDEGDDSIEDEHSPGGIVVESLLNVRTIASLTMEEIKLVEYAEALHKEDMRPWRTNCIKGSGAGLGQFFQNWGLALMFWFGGWLLNEFPDQYSFREFIICMMALFFSLYGLTVAFEGATDRAKAKVAAERIFSLTDRASSIDPLNEGGERPDDAFLFKASQGKSTKKVHKKHHKHKRHSSKKLLEDDGLRTETFSGGKKAKHQADGDDPGAENSSIDNEHKRKSSKNVVGDEDAEQPMEKPPSDKQVARKKKRGSSKKLSKVVGADESAVQQSSGKKKKKNKKKHHAEEDIGLHAAS